MRRLLWPVALLMGLGLSVPAFAEGTGTKSKPIQEGSYYSPTMGFVKTSSVQLNPATDYLENEHRKSVAEQEAEEKTANETAAKTSKKKSKPRKRKVLIS